MGDAPECLIDARLLVRAVVAIDSSRRRNGNVVVKPLPEPDSVRGLLSGWAQRIPEPLDIGEGHAAGVSNVGRLQQPNHIFVYSSVVSVSVQAVVGDVVRLLADAGHLDRHVDGERLKGEHAKVALGLLDHLSPSNNVHLLAGQLDSEDGLIRGAATPPRKQCQPASPYTSTSKRKGRGKLTQDRQSTHTCECPCQRRAR